MDDRLRKTERLIRIWILLQNNPFRFSTKSLAERFGVNVKTIYRDLDALTVELRVPVDHRRAKWGIGEGYFLPPIRLTVPEALTLFLAARLMLNYSHRYDPHVDSTFTKLSSAVPPPLREQIQKTIDWMQKLPRDDRSLRTLAKLAEGWVSQRRLRISYRSLPADEASDRIIEPYFIEPAAPGHSSYVVAYCTRASAIRVFKVERIEGIDLTDETYTIPADFDANKYFSGAWGIVVEGEEQTVRLRFSPEIARLMEETIWHPSQATEKQVDGSVIMTLRVFHTAELATWVLGWGEKVEVLEPVGLRKAVRETAKAMVGVYIEGKIAHSPTAVQGKERLR